MGIRINFISALIGLLIFISCKSDNVDPAVSSDEPIFRSAMPAGSETHQAFKMILDHPDLQAYLHPEKPGRVPLVLKGESQLIQGLSHKKFQKPVQTLSNSDATPATPYFQVEMFAETKMQIQFALNYEAEGIGIRGRLVKSDGKLVFSEYEISGN